WPVRALEYGPCVAVGIAAWLQRRVSAPEKAPCSDDILVVFVKEPRPGAAKTRLVPELGAEAAAELYRALADEEIRRTVPRRGEYRRLFFFAPAEARGAMEAWLPGEVLLPQTGTDLGARMAEAFEQVFRRGPRPARPDARGAARHRYAGGRPRPMGEAAPAAGEAGARARGAGPPARFAVEDPGIMLRVARPAA